MSSTLRRLRVIAVAAVVAVLAAPAPAGANESDDRNESLIVAERFSPQNQGNPQIVTIRPSDGRVRVLTSGNRDLSPDLAVGGSRIVFQRCRFGLNCDDIGRYNIWAMRADGSDQHPLTHCDGTKCLGAFHPAFSPDGRRIAFSEDLLDPHGVNFNGIFLMRTDGSDVHRVTSSGPDGLPDSQPRFSPDGRHLVFERELPTGNQLMIVRVDGTGLRSLLPGVDGFAPHWSPNGRLVVFQIARHRGGTTTVDIATVRPDGSHLRFLTRTTPDTPAFTPDFSPDGRRVVFSQAGAQGCALVTSDLAGRRRHTLSTGPGCVVEPSWARVDP